jgi:hypothetical protein
MRDNKWLLRESATKRWQRSATLYEKNCLYPPPITSPTNVTDNLGGDKNTNQKGASNHAERTRKVREATVTMSTR